ncbi:MAG: diacylglycerol kinase [Candidatus Paceibacterota bacterium]|jgi:diacylglycerol kinase (ATP)
MTFGKTWQSFSYARRGLKTVWAEEKNFRIEVAAAAIVAGIAFYFKFSFVEISLVTIAAIVVLMSEIINTTIEDVCDKIEPNHDARIEKIKDVGASLSLVSSIGAAILGISVFAHHFWF